MSRIEQSNWGVRDGKNVFLFTFTNSCGATVRITNYGGIVTSICVPDRNGEFDDVTLGFDSLEKYFERHPYFGALVGRCANRIFQGRMKIGDKEYQLAVNGGRSHLHGGLIGFDKKVWNPEIVMCEDGECLELCYFSRDGEENYPGGLDVKVRYSLSEDNSLKIQYFAKSDADTVINLTNHAYINLSGHGSGDILKHEMTIYASRFTPISENMVPTGEIRNVAGTPMDFNAPHPVGERIDCGYEQLALIGGYDHNYVLDHSGVFPGKAAEVYDPVTGRVMEVFTTMPGMQFYTSNFMTPMAGKGGAGYDRRGGLCLETQYYPDSVNHSGFPSPILKAGENYNHTTIYKFSFR